MTTDRNDNTGLNRAVRFVVLVLAGLLLMFAAARLPGASNVAVAYEDLAVPGDAATDAVTATVRFAQDVITATVNVPIVVELVVDDVEFLGGWQTVLAFDPAQLEVTSVALGDFLASQGRSPSLLGPFPESAGQLAIGGYTYGAPPGVSGSGVLAQISITPLTVGNAALDLANTMLTSLDDSASAQVQPNSAFGAEIRVSSPLAMTLESFEATSQHDGVLVTWVTVSEINNRGFNLYRATTTVAPETLLANIPSQSPGSGQGYSYQWLDSDVVSGETYYYWLEDVSMSGVATLHEPVEVQFQIPTAVTLNDFAAATLPEPADHGWIAVATCLILLFATVYFVQREPESGRPPSP